MGKFFKGVVKFSVAAAAVGVTYKFHCASPFLCTYP